MTLTPATDQVARSGGSPGVTDGSQEPDIATIPTIALRQVEGAARRRLGAVRLGRDSPVC